MSQVSVRGFRAAGFDAEIKDNGRKDLALIASDTPCTWTGVFTTNIVQAACVVRNKSLLASGNDASAVIINSGNANAYTGEQGAQNDQQIADYVAATLNLPSEQVLTLSTGVIGLQLTMSQFEAGVPAVAEALTPDGWEDAASAIMTTDTFAKLASAERSAYRITGIAKGAGMIAPNMATMLSIIATDAVIAPEDLQTMLNAVAEKSFNRIVVDGDMSTNDTILLLANGASGISPDLEQFQADLQAVAIDLAQSIVRDGEGASKFVTINIVDANNAQEATTIARSIATSPLCKTAFHGADPNWGRIIAAAGYAGVPFDPARLSLWLMDSNGVDKFQLVGDGTPLDYDEPAAITLMQSSEWGFRLSLGQAGSQTATVWTCDLSHDYVTINGDYRT